MKYIFLLLFSLCACGNKEIINPDNYLNNASVDVLKDYSFQKDVLKYGSKVGKIISGHRGTDLGGVPENSLEAFKHVLKFTPAFFEVDPRLTKDSVIVLLHDETLNRTTNGKGKLSNYTWSEVREFRLKDKDGNLTPYRIPTLQEAIDWARGKTVLNLDKKDVPMKMITELIKKNKAEEFIMVTVHDAQAAKYYYENNPKQLMSIFVLTEQALKQYESVDISWKYSIAYIGSQIKYDNVNLIEILHNREVKCMISTSSSYDKLETKERRLKAYKDVFLNGVDIVESDFPIEVSESLNK